MAATKNLILLGEVVKPHGIKGELCIVWHADSPLILDDLSRVYLRIPGERPQAFKPLEWREHKKKVLLFLGEISGRDQAEGWRGAELLMSSEDLPPIQEHEVYLHELTGCAVFLPDGTRLGRIQGFLRSQDNEVWSIVNDQEQEILFPAQDEFILALDPENQNIVIDPPEGLLDLYLQD